MKGESVFEADERIQADTLAGSHKAYFIAAEKLRAASTPDI